MVSGVHLKAQAGLFEAVPVAGEMPERIHLGVDPIADNNGDDEDGYS